VALRFRNKANLIGNRIKYRITTPKHHKGNRYRFQFHGSGGLDLKHLVNESCPLLKVPTNKQTTQAESTRASRIMFSI